MASLKKEAKTEVLEKETFEIYDADFEEPFEWTNEGETELEQQLEAKISTQFCSLESMTVDPTPSQSSSASEKKDSCDVSNFYSSLFHFFDIVLVFFHKFIKYI